MLWRRGQLQQTSNDILSEAGLSYVGGRIVDYWVAIAKRLGLTTTDIENIEARFPPNEQVNQSVQALITWRDNFNYSTNSDKIMHLLSAIKEITAYQALINDITSRFQIGVSTGKTGESSSTGTITVRPTPKTRMISDASVNFIAANIITNWVSIAQELGIIQPDILQAQQKYPGKLFQQAIYILKLWRDSYPQTDTDKIQKLLNTFRNDQDILQYLSNQDGIDITGVQPDTTTTQSTTQPTTVVPTTMSTAPPKIYPGPLKDGSLRKYVSVFGSDWLSLLLKLGMTHEDIAKVPYNNDQNERTFEALKFWRDLPNEDYNTKIAKMLKVLEGIQEPSKPEGAEFNIKEKTTDEVLGPNTRPVDQVVPTVQYKQIRKSDILTDQGLRDLAYNIKSNWETVAQNLGITAEEQQNIKTMYPGDRERQAYEILDLWKRSEPGTVDSKITLLLDSLKDTKPTYIDGYTITKKPLTDLLLFPGFEYILNMLNQDQWIRLVEYLGVPQSQINQLKNDYPQLPRKQAINGLEFWKGSYNAKPEEKVRDVLTALDKLGRPDVKQNIERDYEGVKDLEKLTPSTSDFGSSVGATSPNTEQREHLNRAWLTSIAQNYKNDWKPILTSLGLTLPDIQQIENRYPGNVLEQAISALILWRDRTASEGYQKQYQNLMKAIDDYVKSKSAEPQQPVVHTITNLDYFDSTHMPYLVKNLPDWEVFMRELGFSDADKQAIMRRYVKAEWALRALLQYKLQYPGTSQEKNNKIHTLLQRLKLFDIIRYFEFVQSASRVSDRISDQDIAFIAQNIGNDWEELLLALGLTPQDLVTIKVSFPQSEWTVRALQKFRDEFPGTKEELNFILYKVLQKFFLNTILEYFLWAPSSKDFLDKTVIRYIANNVGAVWETFLINLGVKQADIDDIKLRYPQGEWILQALMKWKNDYPGSYRWKTYRMYEILQRMKLTNILNGIQQDPTKSQKSVNDLFLDPAFQEIAKWLLEQGPHVWKIVMRSLGLPVNDITTLESYYPNQPVTQAARAIELWSNRVGDDNLMKAKWLLYVLKQQNQVKLENYLRDTYGLKDIVAEPGTVKPVTGSQNQEYITGTDIVKSDQLTNAWLERVAALFGTDWDIVAKLLGLTPNQIETIKQMYPSDPLRQATKALTMWRDASTDNQEQQYIILTNAIDKFNRRQIGGQVFDYPDLLATDGIEYFVRVLGSNWEVLMRQLGVQQIDIDYIKSNFPRNDWIRRTLYKWRDEYTGTRQQKNINLYKKLKEMNMMEHINYFKKPTYKPVSELFLIPGLEDIVQRLNQYGPEAWKTLVTLLKLSPDDIRVMELYYRNDLLRQAVHALELWSNRNGVDNNFKAKTLSKALRDNGNPDVADYLDKTYGVKDLTHSQDPNQAVIRPQGLEYIPGTDIQKPNELTDTLLMRLAEIFSKNWEPVARELGLSTSVIDKIKLDFLNDRVKQAYQALLTWKTRSTDSFVNQFNLLRRILYDFHQTRLSVKQTPGQAQTEVPTYRIIDRRDILTDKGLEDLAFNLDKNWIRVATNLGLTDEVIQQIQDVYTNDVLKQALEALKIWRRDAPGTNAQRSKILLDALRGLPLSFIKGQETVKKSTTDLLTYPGLQTIVERLASDEWKKLVQWLKLPVQDIRNIMDKFPNLPDKQATEALWLWNTKTGGIPDDKVRDLISSLNKIGRNDVGTYITDTYGVKDKSFKNTTPIYTGSNEGLVQPGGIPYEPTTGQPIDTVQPTEPSTGPYNINTPQTQPGDNVNVPQIQPGDNVNLPQVQPSDSGRTLNDIWKEIKIYVNLREFATKLGSDWEQLVRVLGLPESTISRLNSLPGGTLPRSIDALLEWTRMSGKTTEDKLQDLFTKLQLLRRYDLVNYLQNRYNIRLLGSNTKTTDAFTKTNPVINEGGPGSSEFTPIVDPIGPSNPINRKGPVDPGYQPGPVDLNQPGTVDPNQEGPVDPNQPGSVEPGYQPGPVDPNQPGPVDPGYQPGPVDPNQPGPVDPGYQPGPVDPNQPGPVDANQPGSVDPGYQPGPVDPNQPGPVDPGYQPGPVDPNKPGSVEPNQPGPVDPNQPGSVDPGYQPGPVDPYQPGPVDPYQPGPVDPGYQPGPVDPNQPGPVDPNQPGPVDPYQPGPVDPGYQPGPVDPDQPGPVDPNEPGPVDPGYQPGPVDPNQPGPVDPNQPGPVDPNQPGPVDPGYQPGPGDPNQPGPVDPFQPGPVDPNQPGPVDPNQPGPVDPGYQPGPVDPNQPGPVDPNQPGPVDPGNQPGPVDPNQPGQSKPDILVDPTYPPRPIQPEIVVDPTYPTRPDRQGTGQTDSILPRQPDQTKPGQVDPLPTNKKKLSDDRLRKIAEGIENDWSRILQLLGMDMIDINLIKLQHLDKIDQAFYALKQWQNSNNDYLTMITKLRNVLQTYCQE
ncbi:hypothetical protein KUTeg_015297 [Tegillarca granosa]|uniref:Death domain-containing protein n=1 Tax=Tegillarca granosa TaxID=220873 RepID=A0ABQ9EV83_TEGGR|nr:hypothetical protein KUTeg_015297 [Tegillarca granosa]